VTKKNWTAPARDEGARRRDDGSGAPLGAESAEVNVTESFAGAPAAKTKDGEIPPSAGAARTPPAVGIDCVVVPPGLAVGVALGSGPGPDDAPGPPPPQAATLSAATATQADAKR
jgi:hypothetical protein